MGLFRSIVVVISLLLTSAEGAEYCSGGELSESEINDAIIVPLNERRTSLVKGEQKNGAKSVKLPAGKGMNQVSWNCELEANAISILNHQCPSGDPAAPTGKCGVYFLGVDNGDDLAYVFDGFLTTIDFMSFKDYSTDLKYSDEYDLQPYANLVNSVTSAIGCSFARCTSETKYSLFCLTNQECLQNGDVIYERADETTSSYITTAFTSPYTTGHTTESTVAETTTAEASTSPSPTTETGSFASTPFVTLFTSTKTSEGLSTTTELSKTAESIAATTVVTASESASISGFITSTPSVTPATISTTSAPVAFTSERTTLSETATTEEPNTMCPDNYGMTDSLRIAILAKQNGLRSSLALGTVSNGRTNNTCRKASKMPTLVYCCELEKTAIDRAKLCDQMDSVPQGNLVENNYNFTNNLNRTLVTAANNAAQLWWSEITKLESGIDQIQNLYYTHLGINSFAKMASDLTTGLGCAVVHCGNRINVVCHYDTTLANAVKLYTCGPTCNRCENGTNSCVNGLCPAASETCSVATTTAAPEATTTTTEPNTLCPNNHGMTDPLRFAILAKHNSLRTALALGTVENGQTGVMCRKASKMPTLTYSCNLECTALARASKCSQMDSTPPQCISENSYNFTKNLNRTLTQAANAATQVWWSELAALESGIDQIQNLFYTHLGISSFAKIASDLTTKIGCAVVHCNDLINVVCHYQTNLTNAMKLYTAGPTCKKCENGTDSCINALCPASSE